MRFYFDVVSLPLVEDEPEIPEEYYVCNHKSDIIACLLDYETAVDLICLIEEFCEEHNIPRHPEN